MKEYGGYIPLEIYGMGEFYSSENVKRFNCARSAIEFVIINEKYKTVYLPYYLCESVQLAVRGQGVEIEFYHIDEDFQPILEDVKKESVVVVTNYFGIRHNNKSLLQKYKNVIYDNTQSFFEPPISGAFNIYSCRKFFGVTDGAYLITEKPLPSEEGYPVYLPDHASFLLNSIIFSTNGAYEEFLKNEEQLEKSGICRMSLISQKILNGLDYDSIIRKRTDNYNYVNRKIGEKNALGKIDLGEGSAPMVYPYLSKDKGLRKGLIDAKIYVPQWWKYLIDRDVNDFEKELSEYLIPLPIDQRYGEDDLDFIINKVYEYE